MANLGRWRPWWPEFSRRSRDLTCRRSPPAPQHFAGEHQAGQPPPQAAYPSADLCFFSFTTLLQTHCVRGGVMDGLSEKLAQRGETGSVGLFAAAVLDVFFVSVDVRSLEHAGQINLRELKHTFFTWSLYSSMQPLANGITCEIFCGFPLLRYHPKQAFFFVVPNSKTKTQLYSFTWTTRSLYKQHCNTKQTFAVKRDVSYSYIRPLFCSHA